MIKTTIICFGDSNTAGYGLTPNSSYCDRLFSNMPVYFPSISWNIHNAGINNNNVFQGLARLDKDVLAYNPNFVFIMFGTNDSSISPDKNIDLIHYETYYKEMITRIKGHNNRTGLNFCIPVPILITCPIVLDEYAAPKRSNNRIMQYNYIVKKMAFENNCPYIDLFEEMASAPEPATLLSQDGFHLSAKGQAFLFDLAYSELSKLITYEGVMKEYNIVESEAW